MRELIEFIARNLVDQPEAVMVRVIRNDRYAAVLALRVADDDLGKVIGRQGRVAKAMRTLMRASAALNGQQHAGLEIDDRGRPRPQPPADPEPEG
ncbi:MAG TPA: KH domain-containing protein [Ktedonobacterales bacterium]|jgi:hypothetical protein|nr:KH domain-containing protein [Ktedonobacterales bacterium]